MIYELNHVGGPVRDLETTLSFYSQLGAQVVDRLFMSGPRVHRVHIQLGSGLIELLCSEQPDPQTTYGLNHIGFMTDDLDGDYARLTGLGYAEISSPRVAGSGQGRLAFLADPNGVRVELLQRTEDFRIPPITSRPAANAPQTTEASPSTSHRTGAEAKSHASDAYAGTQHTSRPAGTGAESHDSDAFAGTANTSGPAGAVAEGGVAQLSYVAITTPDLDAAREFYGTHLGMHQLDDTTFHLGTDTLKLTNSLPPATTTINHLALTTPPSQPDLRTPPNQPAHTTPAPPLTTTDPDNNRLTFLSPS